MHCGGNARESFYLPTHPVLSIAVRVDVYGVPSLEVGISRSLYKMCFWNMVLVSMSFSLAQSNDQPSDLSTHTFHGRHWMLHTLKLLLGFLELGRTSHMHKNSGVLGMGAASGVKAHIGNPVSQWQGSLWAGFLCVC